MNNLLFDKRASNFLPTFCLILSSLIFLPAFAAAQTGIPAADREMKLWNIYEPERSNFRVSLPVQPVASTVSFETKESTLDMQVVTARATSSTYSISYVDLDYPVKDAKGVDAAFENARSEAVTKLPSAVAIGERKTIAGRFPGREYNYSSGASNVKMQIFLVKQRCYIVQLISPQTDNLPAALIKIFQAESNKFFNSFQILEAKKPESAVKAKSKK